MIRCARRASFHRRPQVINTASKAPAGAPAEAPASAAVPSEVDDDNDVPADASSIAAGSSAEKAVKTKKAAKVTVGKTPALADPTAAAAAAVAEAGPKGPSEEDVAKVTARTRLAVPPRCGRV